MRRCSRPCCHLSNAEFDSEPTTHGDDCAKLVDACSVDYAAYAPESIGRCSPRRPDLDPVKTARDGVVAHVGQRHREPRAFVSAVYAALFEPVDRQPHQRRSPSTDAQQRAAEGYISKRGAKFIGVLDIFDFEDFNQKGQYNSFPQLCTTTPAAAPHAPADPRAGRRPTSPPEGEPKYCGVR